MRVPCAMFVCLCVCVNDGKRHIMFCSVTRSECIGSDLRVPVHFVQGHRVLYMRQRYNMISPYMHARRISVCACMRVPLSLSEHLRVSVCVYFRSMELNFLYVRLISLQIGLSLTLCGCHVFFVVNKVESRGKNRSLPKTQHTNLISFYYY